MGGTGQNRDRAIRNERGFLRDEGGAMLVFALFMFILMLAIGGLAVDIMRHEVQRTRLQNTTDGAVLAAASLTQSLDPELVVADFFEKSGQAGVIDTDDILVEEGINFRTVSAQAQTPMRTLFMNMIGIDEMTVPAVGSATERIPKVEISLVLDISGSMRFTDSSGVPQIDILRPAANSFIERMLDGDRKELISINLVPYAGSTNPGSRVFDLLGGVADHTHSNCMELAGSEFDHSGPPTTASSAQVPHFMYWTIAPAFMDWGWCPAEDASIRYVSADVDHLTSFVDNVRLHDGTGTHFGVRWALAMLDPGAQGLVSQLVADGTVEPKFSDRPAAWDDPETLKVIVLMTDGAITDQWRPTDPEDEDNLDTELQNRSSSDRYQLTSRTTNRNRFFAACAEAKARDVTVFTIAFNTTSGDAANEMQTCASTPSHYYNVTSNQLDTAFQAIAGAIQMLRLTK